MFSKFTNNPRISSTTGDDPLHLEKAALFMNILGIRFIRICSAPWLSITLRGLFGESIWIKIHITFLETGLHLTPPWKYSWINLVVPKNWAYFSAISGRKFDQTTVLRSCWHKERRRRGFIASGPFFSLFLTFAHEKNHCPVVKSGFWGHISH